MVEKYCGNSISFVGQNAFHLCIEACSWRLLTRIRQTLCLFLFFCLYPLFSW